METPTETKECFWCKTDLPVAAFNKNRAKKDGLQHVCRECFRPYKKEQSKKNGKYRHGLNRAKRQSLIDSQGGVCAICGETPHEFHVDHDHACCDRRSSCGKCIRGLLCRSCNLGLGNFRDNPEFLKKAVTYLAS